MRSNNEEGVVPGTGRSIDEIFGDESIAGLNPLLGRFFDPDSRIVGPVGEGRGDQNLG